MILYFSRAYLVMLGRVSRGTMRNLLHFYFAASVHQCSVFSEGVVMEGKTFPGETGSCSPLTLMYLCILLKYVGGDMTD